MQLAKKPLAFTASSARLRSALVIGVLALTIAGCHDYLTAPQQVSVPPSRRDLICGSDCGSRNSSVSGSYDGVIDAIYGGAPKASEPTGRFVYPTFITVHVSGEVHQIPDAYTAAQIAPATVRQAYGSAGDPAGAMGLLSGGGVWVASDTAAILRVVDDIYGFRNDAGGQPLSDATHCGIGAQLCWSWSGSAHLSFERIHVGLTLSQAPDTAIWKGASATFTAGASQTYFGNNPNAVNISEVTWKWFSDDGAAEPDCSSASSATCSRVFTTSGTLYLSAYVNGEQQQQERHITVKDPCHSGFAPIDNTVMDTAMKSLWRDSHYSPITPMSDRREQGGWIILQNGQYSFQRFALPGKACEMTPDYLPPNGAVGAIHTHPFELLELLTACPLNDAFTGKQVLNPDGTETHLNYLGIPSPEDRQFSLITGMFGYIMDKRKLRRFGADEASDSTVARCAY